MKKTVRNSISLLATCILCLSLGCVTRSDMDTLQIERQQDLNRIKQLEAELEESKQLIRDDIEKSQTPVREKAADMWAEMQSMRKDFSRIRGELDSLNMRIDRQVGDSNSTITMTGLSEQLNEIEFVLENQLQVDLSKVRKERGTMMTPSAQAAMDDPETAETPTPGQTVEKSAPSPAAAPASNDPAKALYDKAYDLYKAGQYEKARSYWAEFTDTFKKHPYTASAVFWQGQCYYKLNDYARAAILFEDVIERYKTSSKYKSALLKAGYSWDYLGKPELAKMRMEEIVQSFPQSVEATQAKNYLKKTK